MESLQSILLFACICCFGDGQFLYPVDENPPNNPLTFTCHECNEESDGNCSIEQTDSSPTKVCSGNRIGCWMTLDIESSTYQRGCEQPATLRQGVFCNRHMEGKEFCYYEATTEGLKRVCSKCCLNDYCNAGLLQGTPDARFQNCIECDGRDEDECNAGGPENFPDHMVEQCLMPNSDCWTGKTLYNGEVFYTRGCQIAECDDRNVEEICTKSSNRTTCLKCCPGGERCNYDLISGHADKASRSYGLILHSCAAVILASYCFQ